MTAERYVPIEVLTQAVRSHETAAVQDDTLRVGIQEFRRSAAGYPLPEFRGHTQTTARPVPGDHRRLSRSPPGLDWSAPAPFARGLGVMAALAQTLPIVLVPEQRLLASMRHDMVDDRRRYDPACRVAGGAQRMPCEKYPSRIAPPRAITAPRRARAKTLQLCLCCRRAAPARRAVHRRLDWHGCRGDDEPAAAGAWRA